MIRRVADFERWVLTHAPIHWLVTRWVGMRKRLPDDDAYVVVFGGRPPHLREVYAFMAASGVTDVFCVSESYYLVARFPDAMALVLRFGGDDTGHSKGP